MSKPRVSIDQWRSLNAVVEAGGFAQAAEMLNRSQSSVSYHVRGLQEQLGVQVLEIVGRKAVLTANGETIYRRSKQLLKDAERLERLADELEAGWEPQIHLVVDTAFPTELLMRALRAFQPESRGTRVRLSEVVLSGADDALRSGTADLAICAHVPDGFLGDHFMSLRFIAVAHPDHRLHQLGRSITALDLEKEMQLIIKDSGVNEIDVGWMNAENQWSVSKMETAIAAISAGLGYCWVPELMIEQHEYRDILKPLDLREGKDFVASLFLVFGRKQQPGPACRLLADILRATVDQP